MKIQHCHCSTADTCPNGRAGAGPRCVINIPDSYVRYCPNCSSIGEVSKTALNCCPDADPVYIPVDVAGQANYGFLCRIYPLKQGFPESDMKEIIANSVIINTFDAFEKGEKQVYRKGPFLFVASVVESAIKKMKEKGINFI